MAETTRRPPFNKGSTQRRGKRDRYTPVACNECKLRKVKCSGHSTCRRCVKHAIQCVYDRMLPAELDATIPSSNGDNIQSKLSQMQASLDTLLQSISPDVPTNSAIQPARSMIAAPSPSVDSRRGSDGSSNATMEDLAALVGIEDTMHRISGLKDAMQSLHSQVDLPGTGNATSRQGAFQHALWPLSRNEALEVIDGFREEIDTLYPFVNLAELRSLLDALYCLIQPQNRADVQTVGWDDMDDSRNLDFLKLIIACGLAARGKNENDISRELMASVEEKCLRRMNSLDVDMKDLAIATMLSVYYYQNDEITLAWRKIGAAARMCLELGVHKSITSSTDTIRTRQAAWVLKMFWCIYVLDRRYSFMTNLPFTFRDEDIDPRLPLPDNSSPFLLPMVSYGRLGAKVMPALPKLKCVADDIDNETCMYLGGEIDRWIQSTAIDDSPNHNSIKCFSSIDSQNSNNSLATFCRIRGNQMRLSLYKHALHSPTRIARNQHFAQLAVHCATDNIRILRQLNTKPSPLSLNSNSSSSSSPSPSSASHPRPNNAISRTEHEQSGLQVQRNFFLISSVAVLYLAIRNAPQCYSGTCVHEYFAALNLLRASAVALTASRKLRETVKTLERATCSLSRGPMLTFGSEVAAPMAVGVGGQAWSPLPGESVAVERAGGGEENRRFGEEEGQFAFWENGGMGCGGGGIGGGHDMWTFTDDMGWLSPPDSYFLESGSSPNLLNPGDYWPQVS